MTTTIVLRGVYRFDGSALVVIGQPAILSLLLTQPNPDPPGPDVAQDLTGRAFVQRILDGAGDLVADAAGQVLDQTNPATKGQVRFQLDADVIAALLPDGFGAIDLTHTLVELMLAGDDVILTRPFGIRTPTAMNSQAIFVIADDDRSRPLAIRYAGAPGRPADAAPAIDIAFDDTSEPPLDAEDVQSAILALAARINLVAVDAALNLQPSWATGARHLAAGATELVLSEAVSAPAVFTLWRGGVLQAPSAYAVDGSATITVDVVGDDGTGGEDFEWIHSGVDPARVAAARAALGL